MPNRSKSAVTTFNLRGVAVQAVLAKLAGFIEVNLCDSGTMVLPLARLMVQRNKNGFAIVYVDGVPHDSYETYTSVVLKMRAAQ